MSLVKMTACGPSTAETTPPPNTQEIACGLKLRESCQRRQSGIAEQSPHRCQAPKERRQRTRGTDKQRGRGCGAAKGCDKRSGHECMFLANQRESHPAGKAPRANAEGKCGDRCGGPETCLQPEDKHLPTPMEIAMGGAEPRTACAAASVKRCEFGLGQRCSGHGSDLLRPFLARYAIKD